MDDRFEIDRLERAEDLRDDEDFHVYKPLGQLKLDSEVIKALASKNMNYRWVRVFLGGNVDSANIRKRTSRSEGYSFVRPEDLDDELIAEIGDIVDLGHFGEAIVQKDCALMKVPMHKNQARKDFYRNKTDSRTRALKQQLIENKKLMDSSKTSVTRGTSSEE